VKIGYTDRTPSERASELSGATGVPGLFKVERSWQLADAQSWERRVHSALAQHRVSGEHFELTVNEAVRRITQLLHAAGLIGDDGLTERERAKIVGAEKARREAEARAEELARKAEAERAELAKAEQQRQAGEAYERQLWRDAFWPRFVMLGLGILMGGSVMLEHQIRTDAAGWMLASVGVAIAAGLAAPWATHALAAAIRRAQKQAAKVARRAARATVTVRQRLGH
jgi:hypothetical protein